MGTAGILNGLINENTTKITEMMLKIFRPLLVYFSNKKNTTVAISVGNTLESITGTIVSGWLGCIKMSSVKKPAALKIKNNTVLIAAATPAAVSPAMKACL